MANTIEECRELCAKYTTLRENELQEIFPFLDDLQMLAEREQANVYIDCMTYTGKSMVIVGEAFPESIFYLLQNYYFCTIINYLFKISIKWFNF